MPWTLTSGCQYTVSTTQMKSEGQEVYLESVSAELQGQSDRQLDQDGVREAETSEWERKDRKH